MSTVPSDPGARSLKRAQFRMVTPIAAILLMAVLNAVLIVGPLRNVVVIVVILFISDRCLRIKEPDLKRPFRVPFGTAGAVARVAPSILIVIFTISVSAIARRAALLGFDGFDLLGADAA
jgi:hypothetical protein